MVEIVAQQLGTKVLDTKISSSIAAAEAPAHQEVLTTYAPKCKAAIDYICVCEDLYPEIIQTEENGKEG